MCCVVPLKSAFFLIFCSSGSCLPTCCTKFKRNAKQYKCMPYFDTAPIEVYALFLHCWCQIPQWHVTTWEMNKPLFAFVKLLWKTQIPHAVVITSLKRKIPAASSFHAFNCSVVSVRRGHLQLDTTRSLYKSTHFLLFDLALRSGIAGWDKHVQPAPCVKLTCGLLSGWNVNLNRLEKSWGCTSGGVYVPCIYTHARWEIP